MKLLTPVLLLSVVLNLVLTLLLLAARIPVATPIHLAPATPQPEKAPAIVPTPVGAQINLNVDNSTYVAQLRADGFPPEIVRNLVLVRLRQKYAARLHAARTPREYAYWRDNPYDRDDVTREERAAINAITREMMAEAKSLLGEDGLLSADERAKRERVLGNLSVEKIQRVDEITKDYEELSAQVHDRAKGLILRADRDELRLLEKEKRTDLAAILSPDELREYDFRASPSATNVRQRLTYFEPTEAEYRAIAQIQIELDQTYGLSNLSGEEKDHRIEAEKLLPGKIAALLSPERFADYEITTDGNFRDTARLLRDEGLDLDVVKAVVGLQRSFTPRIESIRHQHDYTPVQRTDALAALDQEATTRLTAMLGKKSFTVYRKYAAAWLEHLRPPSERATNP